MKKISKPIRLIFPIIYLILVNDIKAQKKISSWCNIGDIKGITSDNRTITNNTLNGIANRLPSPNGVIVLPLVFHILYDPSIPNQNTPDISINQQIARLNNDFRRFNNDASLVPPIWSSLVSDMKIEFKLACIDPNGNVTNGIVRTPVPGHGPFCGNRDNLALCPDAQLTSLGGDDAWPTDTYLNIWVCDMEAPFSGLGMLPEYRLGNTIVNGTIMPSSLFDGIIKCNFSQLKAVTISQSFVV
jgi:hypothetical protein